MLDEPLWGCKKYLAVTTTLSVAMPKSHLRLHYTKLTLHHKLFNNMAPAQYYKLSLKSSEGEGGAGG